MKKLLVTLVSVMLVFTMLAGCTGGVSASTESASAATASTEVSAKESTEASAEASAEETSSKELSSEWSGLPAEATEIDWGLNADEVAAGGYKIGFAQCAMDCPYRINMVDRAQTWCNENGVKLVLMDGEGESVKEVSNVESLIAQGVNAIVISSHAGVALTPALEEAKAAGIPIVLIDGGKPFDDWTYVTWMSTDDFSLGEIAGNMLVEDFGGQGTVCVLEGTSGSSCTEGRHEGFYSVINQNPGIKVVTEQDGNWLRKNAVDIVTNALQSTPDLSAVYAHNDEMALGAVQAIEASGLVPGKDVIVYSAADYQENCFEAIKAGKIRCTNIYKNDADWACETAIAYLKGIEIPNMINLGTRTCTIDNVDTETYAY